MQLGLKELPTKEALDRLGGLHCGSDADARRSRGSPPRSGRAFEASTGRSVLFRARVRTAFPTFACGSRRAAGKRFSLLLPWGKSGRRLYGD